MSRRRPARAVGGPETPEGELAGALAASTRDYRLRLSVDLAFIDALLREGQAMGAAHAVEHERQVLQGLAADLHETVAAATLARGA